MKESHLEQICVYNFTGEIAKDLVSLQSKESHRLLVIGESHGRPLYQRINLSHLESSRLAGGKGDPLPFVYTYKQP